MSKSRRPLKGVYRVLRYLGVRGATIVASLLIAVFLVVVVANLGGRLDYILFDQLKTAKNNELLDPNVRITLDAYCRTWCENLLGQNITQQELDNCINYRCRDEFVTNETKLIMRMRYGIDLDSPVILRMVAHWYRAITFDLGRSRGVRSYHTQSDEVKAIIAEAIPQTVLLFTTASIIIFFVNITLGLYLSRRYGKLVDKIAVSLAPLSSMPGWFYGIMLVLIFGIWLRVLPDGGMMSTNPPEDPLLRALDILRHMILPIASWMIAGIPIGTYSYRTFFLIFSTEEYVEYARVRGVPERTILRRYILKPTLPPIITNFVLILIGSWMGAIITEQIFRWPGLGTVFARALGEGVNMDVPVVVGILTIYAYLLAISVFLLDIIYAIVDPRVRVGGD